MSVLPWLEGRDLGVAAKGGEIDLKPEKIYIKSFMTTTAVAKHLPLGGIVTEEPVEMLSLGFFANTSNQG